MKCLLPVFPSGQNDRARLLAPFDGEPFFLRAVRSLAGHPGLSPVLATGDRDVAELAKTVLPVLELPEAGARDDDFPLPPGTRDCLAARVPGDMDPAAPLIVCDCRYPFLDGELADRAGAQWDGRRPLVGIRIPEDHPVQLQVHYSLHFADALVRLDPARPDLPDLDRLAKRMVPENAHRYEVYVSRPMAVDWSRHGIGSPTSGGPYVLVRGKTKRPWSTIVPLHEVPESSEVPCDIAAGFVDPTAASARRLVFLPPREAPAALPFLGSTVSDCLGFDEQGTVRLFLRADLWREGDLLKAAPFAGLRPMAESAASQWLGPPGGADVRVWQGRAYIRTDVVIPETADGAIVAIQTPSFGTEATHTELAFPETCLWDFDPARRICLDRKSGEPIVGRQLFPEIYELCPAMVLGRAEDLAGLREGAPMAGFPLTPPYSLTCDGDLGFFRCLVRIRREKGQRP